MCMFSYIHTYHACIVCTCIIIVIIMFIIAFCITIVMCCAVCFIMRPVAMAVSRSLGDRDFKAVTQRKDAIT